MTDEQLAREIGAAALTFLQARHKRDALRTAGRAADLAQAINDLARAREAWDYYAGVVNLRAGGRTP